MKKTTIIVGIWLILANVFFVIAANRFNLARDTAYPWIEGEEIHLIHSWNPSNFLVHWDAFWYKDIAEHGYSFDTEKVALYNVVFLPLYPICIFFISKILVVGSATAGIIVSILSLFVGAYFLQRLTKEYFPNIDAELPLMYMLIFPTAIFLVAPYAESLFFALSVASIYYAMRKSFWIAGILGGLAAMTRINGIMLFLPLIILYLESREGSKKITKEMLAPFLVPVGTGLYFTYLWFRFGSFWLYMQAEAMWGRAVGIAGLIPSLVARPAIVNFSLDLVFFIVACVCSYFVWNKISKAHASYMIGTVVLVAVSGSIAGIGRYMLVLFPIYLLIASLRNKYLQYAWAFGSVMLFALYSVLFINDYWAG
jgi:hypothetical protein